MPDDRGHCLIRVSAVSLPSAVCAIRIMNLLGGNVLLAMTPQRPHMMLAALHIVRARVMTDNYSLAYLSPPRRSQLVEVFQHTPAIASLMNEYIAAKRCKNQNTTVYP
eukprot:scaffold9985_cov23-Prasinocladus_malaysianus.AAC.1